MTNQPSLFDVPTQSATTCCPHCRGTGRISIKEATARGTDPSTSQRAGARHQDSARFRATSRQAQVLACLNDHNFTAQECAIWIHGENAPVSAIEGTRRRISSLYRIALIEPSGDERNNNGSDTPSIVWQITDRGRAALNNLARTGWSQ